MNAWRVSLSQPSCLDRAAVVRLDVVVGGAGQDDVIADGQPADGRYVDAGVLAGFDVAQDLLM